MLRTIIVPLFLQHIPESIALVILASLFLLDKLNLKTIIPIGIIGGVFVFILRSIPFTFGFHTIIFLVLLILGYKFFYQKKLFKCSYAVLKSFIILCIFEIFTVFISTYLLGLNLEKIMEDPVLKSLAITPQIFLLYLTAFIYYRKRTIKNV